MLDNGSRDGSAQAAQAARDGRPDDRAGRAARQGTERLRAAAPRARALRAAAQRGLRAAAGRDAGAVACAAGAPAGGLRGSQAAAPGRRASSRRRGAFRRRSLRSPARCCCTAATPCRAAARRRARSTGASPRRCWCGARRPSRSASWTPTSSCTPTRSTSRVGCATPAGAACTCRAPRRSTTSSCRRRRCRERRIVEMARNRDLYMRKHHSAAAARAVRWLTAWPYALRALAAIALPGHSPRATGATSPRRCDRRAARACARPPSATTAKPRRTREPVLKDAGSVAYRGRRARRPRVRQRSFRGSSAYSSTSPCPARKAATRRRPSAISARAWLRSSAAKKRVSTSSTGTSASHARAARAREAAGRQQQLAGDRDAGEDRRQQRQTPPLEADGEQPRVSRCMTSSIATYAPHSAMPAPAIPRFRPPRGTSTQQQRHVDRQAGCGGGQVARRSPSRGR